MRKVKRIKVNVENEKQKGKSIWKRQKERKILKEKCKGKINAENIEHEQESNSEFETESVKCKVEEIKNE